MKTILILASDFFRHYIPQSPKIRSIYLRNFYLYGILLGMIHAPNAIMEASVMATQAAHDPSRSVESYSEEVDLAAKRDCPCCGRSLSNYLKWIGSLHSTYKVRQGSVFVLTDETCPLFISIFGNCFGNNPASPYIMPQPPIEDSYVDPYYAAPLNTTGPHGATTNMIYRLSDREALITIITYPPKAAYFGYQSYVFTRMMSEYVGIVPPFARTPSPDPARYEIFGSMGNDINNVIVERKHGVPWGRIAIYITTSNATLAHALIANAMRHGISRNSIFVEPIGLNVITGNGAEADDMLTLIRYAIPQSNSASSTWMNAIHQNVLVYKVSQPAISVSRYGQNLYTPHTVNTQETNFTPSLSIALQQLQGLLEGYLETAQGFPVTSQQMPTLTTLNAEGIPEGGLVGSSCIAYGTNCLGDDQDTSTYAALTLKTLGAEETAFIIGINHSALNVNNVYYTSLSIYDTVTLSGVASSSQTNPLATGFNSGLLTGSAQAVLQALGIAVPPGNSELITNLPNLYITFLARDIHNPTIAPASEYGIDLMGTSLVPIGHPISISERSYVVPGSTTGGNLNYMLYPIVIAATHDFP